MGPDTQRRCMKYSTLVGSMLLLFPNGLIWYWGNLSVYTMSYYVVVLNTTFGVDMPLIISAVSIFWSVGLTSSESLAKIVGRRRSIVIGSLITNIGIFSGYFSVQNSLLSLTVSMGVAVGLGNGLMDSSGLQMVIEWADRDTGTLTTLVQGSMGLGAFILNQLITLYANPRNLIPDFEQGQTKYFTQKEVLDKVPTTYIVIGCFAVTCHLFGFFMLRPKPEENSCHHQELKEHQSAEKHWKDISISVESLDTEDRSSVSPTITSNEYTPKDMLKTISFYAIWFSFFIGDITFVTLFNFYKMFGQIRIPDDHFLTDVVTTFTLASAFTSFFWGLAMDKFGVKNSFILYTAIASLVQTWYYFCPMVNRWVYAVGTVLLGCMSSVSIACYTTVTVLLYGKKHFTTNYGLVMTSILCFSFIAPSLIDAILSNLGWFPLLAIAAGFNIIRFVMITAFLPRVRGQT